MKTIIEMAREAGLEEMWELTPRFIGRLEAFAELVRADERADLYKEIHDPLVLACKKMVADEREACAKVCDDAADNVGPIEFDIGASLAVAIRARGNA